MIKEEFGSRGVCRARTLWKPSVRRAKEERCWRKDVRKKQQKNIDGTEVRPLAVFTRVWAVRFLHRQGRVTLVTKGNTCNLTLHVANWCPERR